MVRRLTATRGQLRWCVTLHDLEAELHQGDSFADPKFVDGLSLKQFDIVIANPVWNQDGYRPNVENDQLGRFTFGIASNGSTDRGWIQQCSLA